MASFDMYQGRNKKGRTYIMIALTPKSAPTRALLQRLKREVNAFEKKWRTAAERVRKAAAKRAARTRKKS